MQAKIPYRNTFLNANVVISKNTKKCVLFVCGGNLSIGQSRFFEWQTNLNDIGISSISFDYIGIPGTKETVKNSSLQSRIEEVETVLNWINYDLKPEEVIIYGVSMGGYVSLGVIAQKYENVTSLILHAPAAYAKSAHDLCFDESFTKTIRENESWHDSLSFGWLEQFKKPVLFLQPELDDVIPIEITERYLEIGNKDINFKSVYLKSAKHQCWGEDESNMRTREEVWNSLKGFIN